MTTLLMFNLIIINSNNLYYIIKLNMNYYANKYNNNSNS